MLPQLAWAWWQYRFGDVNKVTDHRLGLWTKREIEMTLGAEKIGDDRITASLHAREQKRRPTFSDHATMDFRKLEVRINLGFDCNDLIFSSEEIEKGAQVRVHSSS